MCWPQWEDMDCWLWHWSLTQLSDGKWCSPPSHSPVSLPPSCPCPACRSCHWTWQGLLDCTNKCQDLQAHCAHLPNTKSKIFKLKMGPICASFYKHPCNVVMRYLFMLKKVNRKIVSIQIWSLVKENLTRSSISGQDQILSHAPGPELVMELSYQSKDLLLREGLKCILYKRRPI